MRRGCLGMGRRAGLGSRGPLNLGSGSKGALTVTAGVGAGREQPKDRRGLVIVDE